MPGSPVTKDGDDESHDDPQRDPAILAFPIQRVGLDDRHALEREADSSTRGSPR